MTKRITNSNPYASVADFKQIFDEDMNSLYLLALLLTADRGMAEQCFVGGLEDATKSNPVFREWARSWARRTIILNAVRVINPRPAEGNGDLNSGLIDTLSAEQQPFAAILRLGAFDRFVYVMSVLEHYSDHQCALLLTCAKQEIVAARSRALQRSGNADPRSDATAEAAPSRRNESATGTLSTQHLVTSA